MSLVLRGGFIVLGAAAIERFSWVFYLFGAFLIYTAVQLVRHGEADEADFEENALIRRARRVLPLAPTFDGRKLLVQVGDRRLVTPMVLVFLAIGTTDLLFALDSIPAIFGLTKHPFIVFTATIFALMGLRQLYFLLGGLLDRLVYLSVGLALVLGFIGVKLVLEALHLNELGWINGGRSVGWAPEIPIWVSLMVIVTVLAATTVASLAASRVRARRDG
jgi:tellurite resistance protein TerC